MHPLGVLPKGNLLYAGPSRGSIRAPGLGALDRLDDTLLLQILALLEPSHVFRLARCSRAAYAYSRHEPMWKDFYLDHANGVLTTWKGNWRKSFVARFHPESYTDLKDIPTPGLYSDVLFQPYLCAQVNVERYFFPSPARPRSNIPRVPIDSLSAAEFHAKHASESRPVILTNGLKSWPSYSSSLWDPSTLQNMYPTQLFRAEALDCTLETYLEYAENCTEDDSPLYLFDSHFVEKTHGKMGEDYQVPHVFDEDLFNVMDDERPDFRWVVSSLFWIMCSPSD